MKSGCNGAEAGHLIEEAVLDQVNRIKAVASVVRVIGATSITNRIVDVKHCAFN
jgi:hypothetical protein